jgi:hypothetical protein
MEQENIDRFNKEAIEILGYEKAPDNFTAHIMEKIQMETIQAPGLQKPIISKWGWLLIMAVVAFVMIGIRLTSSSQSGENELIPISQINELWTRYIHPLFNTFLIHASQFGIIALIGITATFMLFADSLIGSILSKLNSRIRYN